MAFYASGEMLVNSVMRELARLQASIGRSVCCSWLDLAIVVAPGLWFDAPYSWDFFNHVARLSVLSAQPDDPVLRFYEVDWALIPNLAMDALFYVVSGLISPEMFMRAIWCVEHRIDRGRRLVPQYHAAWPAADHAAAGAAALLQRRASPQGFSISRWARRLASSPSRSGSGCGEARSALRLVMFNAISVLLFFSHLVALAAVLLVITWIEVFPTAHPAPMGFVGRVPRWSGFFRRACSCFAVRPAGDFVVRFRIRWAFIGPFRAT